LVAPDRLRVKLGDFGLSLRLPPGERAVAKVGSPYYVAPEILTGDYDCRADLWGLGVILYMLLSGAPPFNGLGPVDIMNAVRLGKVSFDDARWLSRSIEVQALIRRFLSPDPACRPNASDAVSDAWVRSGEAG